jgi:IS30 family transposase
MPKQTLAHNEELVQALCDSIATGMYVNLACQSVGISTSALSEWKIKGQKGIHPYDKVWKRIQVAEAKAIERRIKRIEQAGESGSWQADAWYLERRYPHLFGKRDTVAIENQDNSKVRLRWADGSLLEQPEEEYVEGEIIEPKMLEDENE